MTNFHAWEPVDIALLLTGDLVPLSPSMLSREDGSFLLYPGLIHSFVGESESLKSWAALVACAQEMEQGHHVFYFDFEDIPESSLIRLLALGVRREDLVCYFHYYNPECGALAKTIEPMLQQVEGFNTTLAVVDGVTEAMTLNGYEIGDNSAIAKWLDALPRKLKRFGPAVVLIDHTPHSDKSRTIGGQHKKAGIDVVYVFNPQSPLSRALHEPVTGISRVSVGKDRPGGVRMHATKNDIGSFHATAHIDGTVNARFVPLSAGSRPVQVMRDLATAMEDKGPMGVRQLRGLIKARAADVDAALGCLVAEGFVTRELGDRNALIHTLVRAFSGETPSESLHHPHWDTI